MASDILINALALIVKHIDDEFPEDEVEAFDWLFKGIEAYYNIRDMVVMTLMPEKG